jgi:diphthamide synthase (EF-2-diphthine--ammonia ligase)
MKRVLLSWSSGKDSAWALHLLRQQPDIELVGLLTTLNTEFQRVAMHGTRRSVLEAQAASANLPLWIVGPMFTTPVKMEAGELVNRDGFVYADFQ